LSTSTAAFSTDSQESWEELRFDAEALRAAGERVVAIGQLSARAGVTGADVRGRIAVLFELGGDKISKVRTYVDVEEALGCCARCTVRARLLTPRR
jgi:ketosteroid isomerase-like protein